MLSVSNYDSAAEQGAGRVDLDEPEKSVGTIFALPPMSLWESGESTGVIVCPIGSLKP